MKYLYVGLVGYVGIYNGLSINEIRLDFTKCKYNKIIIRGKNGSGKSTLMSAINPFPESNEFFVPETEARKTLNILHNGIEYVIRYIHPVNGNGNRGTTKGYIAKSINGNMIELNPNGNISSCKDIMHDELGIDQSYVTLSKLSSENRGLVDSKPAERKKIVNTIISTLEVYNSIYKNLSKKASAYKILINSITSKMNFIGNEVQLNSQLASLNGRIESLEQDKNRSLELCAAIKVKISEYEQFLIDNNYNDIVGQIKELSRDISSMERDIKTKLSNYNISIDKVVDFIDYLSKQELSIEAELNAQKAIIPSLLAQREAEFKDLQNKQERLNSLQSEYNYLDIKQAMEQAKSIVNQYDSVFNEMGLSQVDLITKDEYDSAMECLSYLIAEAKNLSLLYSREDMKFVLENNPNTDSIQSMQIELQQLEAEINGLAKDIEVYKAKRETLGVLSSRPDKCKIDNCPFIESALKTDKMYPKEKLNEMDTRINALNLEYHSKKTELNALTKYAMIKQEFLSISRELDGKFRFISKLPIRADFKDSFITRMVNGDPFDDINKLYKYVDYSNILEEYKLAKRQLHEYEMEYKIYESKSGIIDELISDIESLNKKCTDLANELDLINSAIQDKEKQFAELKATKSKFESISIKIIEEYNPSVTKRDELTVLKESLDKSTSELDDLRSKLEIANHNIGAISNDIKNLSNERDNINHSLKLLDEYTTELALYNDKYTKIEKIRYYSSPSTGIQTLYMEMYMNKILSTANELLSMLFDGEFVLQRFIINENEFRIPCIGNGLIHDDISSMSTAQKSMISSIISASILYQASSTYNILFFDEIDGGLDTGNRSYFNSVINRIRAILNCEQIFMVSHNNELDTYDADIIVLKSEPGEQYAGNIIWYN